MDNKDLDNAEDKEMSTDGKTEAVECRRKEIIDRIRKDSPELSEDELEEMADVFFFIERITNGRRSRNPLKILRKFLGGVVLSFIVYMSGFGLFSYFIEIKEWYVVLLYFISLAFIDRMLKFILRKVKMLNKHALYIDFTQLFLLFMLMMSFNERFDYLVFDNLLTIAIFLMVAKVIFIFLEFKIIIFKLKRS